MNSEKTVRVWDLGVRLFHWALVATFITSYLSDEMHDLHTWSGYTLIGLLLFRITWGFVGGVHARFADFLYSPRAVSNYLLSLKRGEPIHYEGHNPAGGWMIYLMLTVLILISFTGLKALGLEGEGPFADNRYGLITTAHAHGDEVHNKPAPDNKAPEENDTEATTQPPLQRETGAPAATAAEASVPSREEHFWSETHELLVNLMLLLIGAHIAGVIVSSRLHRENLVHAMITGKKTVRK